MIDSLSMLNTTATIRRPTAAVDASGTPKQTFVTVATHVPCAINRKSQTEGRVYDKMTSIGTHAGLFLASTTIGIRDRIVCASLEYDVVGVNAPRDQDGQAAMCEVDLELTE